MEGKRDREECLSVRDVKRPKRTPRAMEKKNERRKRPMPWKIDSSVISSEGSNWESVLLLSSEK